MLLTQINRQFKIHLYDAIYGILNIFNKIMSILPIVLLIMVLVQLVCSSISTVYCMDNSTVSQCYFYRLRVDFTDTNSLTLEHKKACLNYMWDASIQDFIAGNRTSAPPAKSVLLAVLEGHLENNEETRYAFDYLNSEYKVKSMRGVWLAENRATARATPIVDGVLLQDSVNTPSIPQQPEMSQQSGMSKEPEVPPLPNESINPSYIHNHK